LTATRWVSILASFVLRATEFLMLFILIFGNSGVIGISHWVLLTFEGVSVLTSSNKSLLSGLSVWFSACMLPKFSRILSVFAYEVYVFLSSILTSIFRVGISGANVSSPRKDDGVIDFFSSCLLYSESSLSRSYLVLTVLKALRTTRSALFIIGDTVS
jgi:hypothetical protein